VILLIKASARAIPLQDHSVQCIVTSPPYWGLRDYGTPGQLGLEQTPDLYVTTMLKVFRECWRVMRDDGTLWLNLGDSYNGYMANQRGTGLEVKRRYGLRSKELKQKDLVGIPWRVAFALQADGWYLRSDIIWSKPNPMPESVTDRPTRAHEYLFLLTKSRRYYYDAKAIQEPAVYGDHPRTVLGLHKPLNTPGQPPHTGLHSGFKQDGHGRRHDGFNARWFDGARAPDTRNRRSVWTVATQPYSGSHFATFPEKLIEPCILAGSKPGDVVLDPFCGSGTTCLVVERHGRIGIGMDLAYHDLARERLRENQTTLHAAMVT